MTATTIVITALAAMLNITFRRRGRL